MSASTESSCVSTIQRTTARAENAAAAKNGSLEVATGGTDASGNAVTFELDFSAELLSFGAEVELAIGGFFFARGAFNFSALNQTLTLSDSSTVTTEVKQLGVGGASAFVGVNGPYENADGSLNAAAMGLSLRGVNFVLVQIEASAATGQRSWYALKATAEEVALVGIDSVTLALTDVTIQINIGQDAAGAPIAAVLDLSGTKKVSIDTGAKDSDGAAIELELDYGAKVLKALGTVSLAIDSYVYLDGAVSIESSSRNVTLTDSSVVAVEALQLGIENGRAFAGVNGPYDHDTPSNTPGAMGLVLTDVDVALALFKPTEATDVRSWTALEATVGAASIVGVDGMTVAVTDFAVKVNRAGGVGNTTAINFSADTLTIGTVELDFAAIVFEVGGAVQLDVFGFVVLNGTFSFVQSSGTLTVTDGTTAESVAVQRLLIGAKIDTAFAGVNGIGLELTDVEFGLGLFKPTDATDVRSWTSLQADVGSAAFTGVDGLTISVSDVSVAVNQAGGVGNTKVADFATSPLTIVTDPTTDPDDTIRLEHDGNDGSLLEVKGDVTLDVFGFFFAEGSFAVKKSSSTITVGTERVAIDQLLIGGTVSSAFAGINGPASSASALGLVLTNVSFGLALMKPRNVADTRSWTALKAEVGSASFIGVDGLTVSVSDLAVAVNQSSGVGNTAAAFAASPLSIATGPTTDVQLDFDGELLQASGTVELDVFGFFTANGTFAFEKSTSDLKLSDGSTVAVNQLLLGATIDSAFAGVSGTGLELSDVEFGLGLFKPAATTDVRSWTALKADVGSASFVGVDDLTIAVTNLSVAVNQGSGVGNSTVADFATSLSITTDATASPADSIELDFAGSAGALLQTSGDVSLEAFGFFSADGSFAFKKSSGTLSVTNGTTSESVAVDQLIVGAHVNSAFAGIGDIGLTLANVDFALALSKPSSIQRFSILHKE